MSTGAYAAAYQQSLTDPDAFWRKAAEAIDWITPPTTILDASAAPLYRWFPGATLNTCFNAVDRHVRDGRGDQVAIYYDSPVTDVRTSVTYDKLLQRVSRFAGALAGLAATGPALGTEKFLSGGIAASYGFDAITVALLGRSKPLGVVGAGLLFGALNAGAAQMQAAAQIPVDIVQVAQAIIVLLIAAPPLVRWLLRLPDPDRQTSPRARAMRKEVAA